MWEAVKTTLFLKVGKESCLRQMKLVMLDEGLVCSIMLVKKMVEISLDEERTAG